MVFAVLIALEIAEYVLGTAIKSGGWLVLAPLAIIGSWPIVRYYMHINQLRHPEE